MVETPFVPDRFQSTVTHYLAYRAHFPAELIVEIIRRSGTNRETPVIDLGCGTGSVAIELARQGMRTVIGIDPDPVMLAAARAEASAANVPVMFVEGSSYDLDPDMAPVQFVTMARSFHWMDRPATLRALDAIVEPEGAVILLSETPEISYENQWRMIMREVQRNFSRGTGGGTKYHASVLLDSPFSRLDRYSLILRRHLNVDDIIGLALSHANTSPAVLGSRLETFKTILRERLLDFNETGEFTEAVEFAALFARRPNIAGNLPLSPAP